MTRWLWYANAALALAALGVLYVGLARLPEMPPDADRLLGRAAIEGEVVAGDDEAAGTQDSRLVAAARSYSQRWVPPAPPTPPDFQVTRVDLPADAAPQVWFDLPDACDTAFTTGEVVEDYAINAIEWQKVTVVKRDTPFVLDVPPPPAPPFTVVETRPGGPEQPGRAWLLMPEAEESTTLEVGESLADYALTTVMPRSVVVTRRGFPFELVVPPPPPPTFTVVYTEPAATPQPRARFRFPDDAESYRVQGDEIEDFTVTAIGPRSATVTAKGYDYVLTVPPPPAPPFAVAETVPDAEPPQARVAFADEPEWRLVRIGDDLAGYTVTAIRLREITVTRRGYEFTVAVPKPPEPDFELVETAVVDPNRAYAWIRLSPPEGVVGFAQGDLVKGYRIEAVGPHSINVTKAHYDYTLEVPPPPEPEFTVVRVDTDNDEQPWAWIRLFEDGEPLAFTRGELIQGYLVVEITPEAVTLRRVGYDFVLAAPPPGPPPAPPPFVARGTLAVGRNQGLAWLQLADSPWPRAFAVGEAVTDDYRVFAVRDGSVDVVRDGRLFTLKVAAPEPRSIEADPCEPAEQADNAAAASTAEVVGPPTPPRADQRRPLPGERPEQPPAGAAPRPAPPRGNQRR